MLDRVGAHVVTHPIDIPRGLVWFNSRYIPSGVTSPAAAAKVLPFFLANGAGRPLDDEATSRGEVGN